ncbi:GIY-YIG nuclease family protein [Streptomyces sp. NPDC052610]|uniref:GIY-YIG nuclease family protein n=1 Tax=Streptomyces sp. NPDC052610 TaxID=3154952 RepID=UPI00341AB04E
MARTALYRFRDAAGSLLYLGISSDPDRRETQHARDAAETWYPLVSDRTVTWFDSREEAEAAEKAAIAAERPRFNVKGSTHFGPEAFAAHHNRQRKATAAVPVRRPEAAARALMKAMTPGELACLVHALREAGADQLQLPEMGERTHARINLATFNDAHRH